MRNLLLSLFMISPSLSVLAQTSESISLKSDQINATMQKGQWFVGVNGTGGAGRGTGSHSDTWSATGQVGYFIANRWVAGLQVSYGAYHATNKLAGTASFIPQPALERNDRYFTPEIFTRYYFADWKVKPFAQLSGGWNFQDREATYLIGENTRISSSSFTAKAALGVSFKLGKRVNLDLMYSQSLIRPASFGDYSGLRLGVTFLIGK